MLPIFFTSAIISLQSIRTFKTLYRKVFAELEVIKIQLVCWIDDFLLDWISSDLVYVFVGGPWALDDFMLSLQEKKLLENGEYMVISVNDEFYNPDLKTVQDSRQSECLTKVNVVMNVKWSCLTLELSFKTLIYLRTVVVFHVCRGNKKSVV